MKHFKKSKVASTLGIINVVVLGIAPVFMFVVVNWFPEKIDNYFPGYGIGINISFILTLMLWAVAGLLAKHPYKRATGFLFTLSNILVPVGLALVKREGFIDLFEGISYHYLSLGLAMIFFVLLLPFYRVDQGDNPFEMKLQFKIDKNLFKIGWGVGIPFFIGLVSLPAIATEQTLWHLWDLSVNGLGQVTQMSFWEQNVGILLRYIAVLYNARILFLILYFETPMTHRS